MKLKLFALSTLIMLAAICTPVNAQTSGIIASLPNQAATLQLLSVLVANQASTAAPTVTAGTNQNYATLGALSVTSSYVGSYVPGAAGTLTIVLRNTLAPSTTASTLAVTAVANYTDNTGVVIKPPASAILTLANVPAVNNIYTAITFSLVVPVTEFVPAAPVTGAGYTVLNNDVYFNPVASLDGGASVTYVIPGTYE